MIRDAGFQDIPGIITVLRDGYARTHYARSGVAQVDEGEAKRLLVQSVHRHGGKHGGATWVQVAEKDGVITGFILGTMARVYAIGDKLMASDLFWLGSPMIDPADPMALMLGMVNWARSCPGCVEVRCGTTAVINEDPKRAGAILSRMGMEQYGMIWRMET